MTGTFENNVFDFVAKEKACLFVAADRGTNKVLELQANAFITIKMNRKVMILSDASVMCPFFFHMLQLVLHRSDRANVT